MATLRPIASLVGLVGLIVGLATPLFLFNTQQGHSGQLLWSDVSPASLSLAVAGLAAWGATLLTGRASVRVFSSLQAILAGTGLIISFTLNRGVEEVAQSKVDSIVGISGVVARDDISLSLQPLGFVLVFSVLGLLVLSGVLGVISPDKRVSRASRFDRNNYRSDGDTWDQLSHGVDPTAG